jgi:tetratricopeptide (TPR) repeat protein
MSFKESEKPSKKARLVNSVASGILVGAMTISIDAQAPSPEMSPTPAATIKLSKLLAANLNSAGSASVSQQNAAKAYAKLLEGERFLWKAKNSRGPRNAAVQQQNIRDARLAFQDAIAANPHLAEAYTALAELAITAPPTDVDEAIDLANLALKIKKDNFGARRILARLYTYKSGLGSRSLDSVHSVKAVDEWKFVASLDPRYAEAWAFLAEFYERQDRKPEQIDALEKWRSSATAIDSQFYRQMTGGRATLSPEVATFKLGDALFKSGRIQQAIDILSQIIADDPDNANAVELLSQAIRSSKGDDAAKAVVGLQQAVYANPENPALVNLLAESYFRAGRFDDAAAALGSAANKVAATDKSMAALHFVSLGELSEKAERFADASAAYERAIAIRGLDAAATLSDDERMFLGEVFERMIRAAKAANRPDDVLKIIDRARKAFGPEDQFADRQLINLYRDGGKRSEALKVVQAQRNRSPLDEGLARQEASLLTELGRVDEAVEGYRKFMASRSANVTQTGNSVSFAPLDTFSSLLFISSLYTQADRSKESIEAANQALAAARGTERRQIARLSIATALQMSGDFAGAESTLRDILKESPNNPIALNNLGYFLLERGERYDEALTMIRKAVDTDPTNPSYLDSLGWANFKVGKLAEAELYLKEALRQDPSSATINEHLGDVYAAQSKPDLAKSFWQRALNLAAEEKDVVRLKKKLGVN